MKAAAHLMRGSRVPSGLCVVFRLVCDSTKLGEAIVVTGDSRRLGAWNPLQGLYLQTNQNDFPVWRSEPVPVEQLAQGMPNPPLLEYKYVIVDQSDPSDITSRWEDFDGNRKAMLTYEQAKRDRNYGLIKLRDSYNKNEETPQPAQVEIN